MNPPAFTVCYADPIQKAVDDYILMEAKARAWDELLERLEALPPESRPITGKLLDHMRRLLDNMRGL